MQEKPARQSTLVYHFVITLQRRATGNLFPQTVISTLFFKGEFLKFPLKTVLMNPFFIRCLTISSGQPHKTNTLACGTPIQ